MNKLNVRPRTTLFCLDFITLITLKWVPESDQLTETDPVKPHEGVPRQYETGNKKEPGSGKKVGANILDESVGAESFSGEL